MELSQAQVAAMEQQNMPLYECAECGEPVIVFDGNTFRTCGHDTAAVLANIQAIVRGVSGIR